MVKTISKMNYLIGAGAKVNFRRTRSPINLKRAVTCDIIATFKGDTSESRCTGVGEYWQEALELAIIDMDKSRCTLE
jgi:hypothetical protein